jgi:hypothetical protein
MENISTVTPSKNIAKPWALKRNFRQSITRSPMGQLKEPMA